MIESPTRLPTLFIPHGGGPWPFMEFGIGPKGQWDRLAAHLRSLAATIGGRPKAVLVISGHWEERNPTLNVGAHPPLLFDYYGFPEHTYRLAYPAPGAPELATRVRGLLAEAGLATGVDGTRGFDHGVFIPFMLIYPDADVPLLQLSLRGDLDAAKHLALGRALAPLREEGVLIVGSGMSYHNLPALLSPHDARANAASDRFDTWLTEAVEEPDPAVRARKLAAWEDAPDALACHPRSEHLVPLFVAAGAGGTDRGRRDFNDHILGKALSGYRFG
jgi:aromatic ring-opening dioxygenase catalytic subunit (LigB family)